MANARIDNLAARDLLDRAPRDARAFGYLRPSALGRLELLHDVLVDGLVIHARSIDPFLGLCNPLLGSSTLDNRKRVMSKRKTPKVPGFMRVVLAENVQRLMDIHYPDSRNRPKALAKDAGVSLSTVQRILGQQGGTGATLDNIEAVANAFELSAYQILIPELDTHNPQVVAGATAAEKRLYRRYQQGKMGREPTLKIEAEAN